MLKTLGHGKYLVSNPDIDVKALDLMDLSSIKAFADEFLASGQRIDGLILNAGIMALAELEYTDAGFEKQIGVNHFGHFYLVQLLEEKILSQKARLHISNTSLTIRLLL